MSANRRAYDAAVEGSLAEAVERVKATRQKVRQNAKWAKAATENRDKAIRQMRAEGASLRAIAEAAGLSHTAIAKILAR